MANSSRRAQHARTAVGSSLVGESRPNTRVGVGLLLRRWKLIAASCGVLFLLVSLAGTQVWALRGRLVRQNMNRQIVLSLEKFSNLYASICWDEDIDQTRLDSYKEAALRNAVSYFEQLVTQAESNDPYVADTYLSLGVIHGRLRELGIAEAALTEGRKHLGLISATSPADGIDALKAVISSRLAWLFANQGKLREAEAAAAEAVQLLNNQNTRFPDQHRTLLELAVACRNRGLIHELRGGNGSADMATAIQAGEQTLRSRGAAIDYGNREELGEVVRDISLVIDCCQLQLALLWRNGDFEQAAEAGLRSVALAESLLEIERQWSRWGYAPPARRYRRALESARQSLAALAIAAAAQSASKPATAVLGRLPVEWSWQMLYPSSGEVIHHEILARGRLAGEFEQQDGLVVSWRDDEWCHTLMPQIAKHVHDRLQLIVLADSNLIEDDVKTSLAEAGVAPDDVTLYYLSTNSVWIRDYGPLALTTAAGTPKLIDATYGGGRYEDEDLPWRLSDLLQIPVVPTALSMDWGGVLCNGDGLCLVSTAMLAKNQKEGFSETAVTAELQRLTGAEQIVYVDPLREESTGHVDVFATFTSAKTLVIGDCRDTDPINADLLDAHAARFQGMQTPHGELQVVRIPMPPRAKEYFGGSYTNVVFANGVLLVPSWPEASPELEAEALAVYRRLLPDWKIATIDARELGYRGGGLHCVTMNIHRLLPKDVSVSPAPVQN